MLSARIEGAAAVLGVIDSSEAVGPRQDSFIGATWGGLVRVHGVIA